MLLLDELKSIHFVDVTMLIAFGHDANTIERADDVIQREPEVDLAAGD